jgi:hypothetical protein
MTGTVELLWEKAMESLLEQETDGDSGAGLETCELERERRLYHEGRRVAMCVAESSSPMS